MPLRQKTLEQRKTQLKKTKGTTATRYIIILYDIRTPPPPIIVNIIELNTFAVYLQCYRSQVVLPS